MADSSVGESEVGISAYLSQRHELEDMWESSRVALANGPVDEFHSAFHSHLHELRDLEGRCFGEPLVTSGGPVDTPRRLWAFIHLVAIPVVETHREAGADGKTHLAEVFDYARELNLLELLPPDRKTVRSNAEVLDKLHQLAYELQVRFDAIGEAKTHGRVPADIRQNQSKIPPNSRTRPLTKTQAAKYLGLGDRKRPDRAVDYRMRIGTLKFEQIPNESRRYIFNMSDFRAAVWVKVSPK